MTPTPIKLDDWTPAERKDLASRERQHGLRVKQTAGLLEVYTNGIWRKYVPISRRVALISRHHGLDHAGSTALNRRLAGFYWPNKRRTIAEYLRGCSCSAAKADGNPRGDKDKKCTKITADAFLDVVQVDVYTFDDVNYLTFCDVHSGRGWVRKLYKKGTARNTPGRHLHKVLTEYAFWESSLPHLPKRIHTDNEPALLKIPHKNLDHSPVNWPQANSKVERMHRELAKMCRFHKTTPDKAIHYLPANQIPLNAPSGGGEGLNANGGVSGIWNTPYDPKKDPRTQEYKGRVLKKGEYVLVKRNPRGRKKSDDWWSGVSKVIDRIGLTTYSVYDGNRLSVRNIDHLKDFSLREDQLTNQLVNPAFLKQASTHLGEIERCNIECTNLDPELKRSWRGKTLWLAYPGAKNMPKIVDKLNDGKFRVAYLCVPELECEAWYKKLLKVHAADWYGCDPGEEHNFWVDDANNDCGPCAVTWWLIKVIGS